MNDSGFIHQAEAALKCVPATLFTQPSQELVGVIECVGLNSACLKVNEVPPWHT